MISTRGEIEEKLDAAIRRREDLAGRDYDTSLALLAEDKRIGQLRQQLADLPEEDTPESEPLTPAKPRRARLRQVTGLDGVRGMAVTAVVIYHFFGDVLPGGYLGVDMFFVLSGFLITSLLLREYRVTGRISLADFWLRRVRRILPAAVLVLVACTAVIGAIGGDLAVGLRTQFFSTLLFFNNWAQIATSQSYFADNEVQVFAHYWSLAVEEQFYVLWPLIVMAVFALAARYGRQRAALMGLTVVLAGASISAMMWLYQPGEDPTRVYYGTDTHAFGLLIGALLSMALTTRSRDPQADSWPADHGPARDTRIAGIIGVLGLGVYVAQLLFMEDTSSFTYQGGLLLTSVCGAAMILGVTRGALPMRWVFDNGVLRWMGQRSFSIYLWHWPVVMIIAALAPEWNVWAVGLLALVVSLLLSEASYQWVENPFRRYGYRAVLASWWRARPTRQQLTDAFRRVSWGVIPVVAAVAVIAAGTGLWGSSDKSQLEQDLEALALANEQVAAEIVTPEPEPDRILPVGSEITAIGDSVMLASSAALQASFPGIYIDGAVSRHYTEGIVLLRNLAAAGTLGDVVFLGFGTNGAAFPGQMDEIIDAAQAGDADTPVILALPYGDRYWMPQARQDILDAARDHDNVFIADWCGAATDNPLDLRDDLIHPTLEGADSYAAAFADALQQWAERDKVVPETCTGL